MMRILGLYALVIAICLSQSTVSLAADKKLTTYQRQVNLMKRINEAEKKKELTVSQAKGLRKDLSKIAVSKQKLRDRNTGKAGTEDMSKVEEHLSKASSKINKQIQRNIADK